jgi:hypothetical protein
MHTGLLEQLEMGNLEESMGDIFIEEAETFSEGVDATLKHDPSTAVIDYMFRSGMSYRQDELSQRLIGQEDHPAFRIIDAALDLLECAQ